MMIRKVYSVPGRVRSGGYVFIVFSDGTEQHKAFRSIVVAREFVKFVMRFASIRNVEK